MAGFVAALGLAFSARGGKMKGRAHHVAGVVRRSAPWCVPRGAQPAKTLLPTRCEEESVRGPKGRSRPSHWRNSAISRVDPMTSSSRSTLAELLVLARGGDIAARERLFASCRNYLAVVARAEVESWLQAKVDPSDIVQQTMLDAHRGLENFRGRTEAEWLGWLRQILNHNAADFVRHYRGTAMRGACREVPLGPTGSDWEDAASGRPEPAAADPTPSEFLMRHERELQVADAMALLSDDHREVILLRNLQRLPFDEVAQRMGRSRPAVQMLWMRAIRALRESLVVADAESGVRTGCISGRGIRRGAIRWLTPPRSPTTSGFANCSTPILQPCNRATRRRGPICLLRIQRFPPGPPAWKRSICWPRAAIQPKSPLSLSIGKEPAATSQANRLPPSMPPVNCAGSSGGNFELLAEAGRGGMGVVYKARQKDLDRTVAMKMILSSRLASPDDVRRFQQEARAVARLRHPNIVGVHEVGQVLGQHYFTMDYIAGRSLGKALEAGPFEPERAAQMLLTVARAVDYLHSQGIVHRDLKPSNILLDDRDQPFVTDFGLAKLFQDDGEKTQTGAILGTPSYMAPEQARGDSAAVSGRTDVYSLGAMLYEMLTGQPPFREDSPLNTLLQVLEGEPTLPSRLNRRVPPELQRICMCCLEKSAGQTAIPRPRRWPTS